MYDDGRVVYHVLIRKRPIKVGDYRHTAVHRWATGTVATPDLMGTHLKKFRNRKDVPGKFANRRQMFEFMTVKMRIPEEDASRTVKLLYRSYYDWLDAASHDQRLT